MLVNLHLLFPKPEKFDRVFIIEKVMEAYHLGNVPFGFPDFLESTGKLVKIVNEITEYAERFIPGS